MGRRGRIVIGLTVQSVPITTKVVSSNTMNMTLVNNQYWSVFQLIYLQA
jgi:hypothetical protein